MLGSRRVIASGKSAQHEPDSASVTHAVTMRNRPEMPRIESVLLTSVLTDGGRRPLASNPRLAARCSCLFHSRQKFSLLYHHTIF